MISSGKRLIVVLGMHRSGTSAITRALNVLGVELGDRLLPPVPGDNAKGYFEDIDLNALNIKMLQALGSDWHCVAPIEPSDVDSLHKEGFFLRAVELLQQKTADVSIFGFKDPRVAKLLPFWHRVFVHCGFDIGYVLALRNPLSVAQSLAKRAGFSREKSYALWLGHVLTSLVHTEEHRRVLVDYDHFLHSPQQGMELLAKRLELPIDARAFQQYQSEFLDEGLRHTKYEANDLVLDQTCPPLVHELYAALIDVFGDNKLLDNPAFHVRTALWGNEFNRLRLNLRWIDNLSTQLDNLNRSIAVHDKKITALIQAALEQDQNVFQKAFDAQWYLKKYPDVEVAGVDPYQHFIRNGVTEGCVPSTDLTNFVSNGLLDRLKELNTQLDQEKLLSGKHFLVLAQREKAFWQQLQQVQREHEQQKGEQSRKHAERERTYFVQLALARRQIETQLLEFAQREKTFSQQLQEIQQAHEQHTDAQSREYAEREQAHFVQLALARGQIETHLLEFAQREKTFSQQLQEIQQAHEQQKDAQSREHAESEQAHFVQLALARGQIETHLLEFAQREKTFSQQLQEIQQAHERQKDAQSREYAEREQALNAELNAKQEELHSLTHRYVEAEKAQVLAHTQLDRELKAIRATYSWRWTAPLRSLATRLGLSGSGRSEYP